MLLFLLALQRDLGATLSSRPLASLGIAFAAGVLTSLTPCVYPMIPITAAIVGGQAVGARERRTARVVTLTLSYVVGLALVYATLGLIAGLTGTMFGSISTNPWLYFVMANLLLAAALMMLDVIPVPIPSALLRRAATAGNGERALGAFVMGAASGLVAAPCGAPVMVAVLSWVSSTRSALLGFLYLFVFSLGMTAVLVVIGLVAGAGSALPKAGPWMLWVKRFFAVVMIGAAEYYLIEMGKLLI
jgi:cytochrome c-type biogenesis protein